MSETTQAFQERFKDAPQLIGLENILSEGQVAQVLELGVPRETRLSIYQSPAFEAAGYETRPELYGNGDGFLATLTYDDGQIAFIMASKVKNPRNPFEMGHAASGGLDLRRMIPIVFIHNGISRIDSFDPFGNSDVNEGEYGKPENLLPMLHQSLGEELVEDPEVPFTIEDSIRISTIPDQI